ncbi:hypothetical protein D3C72_1241070 [compost metagenome]
MEFGLAGHLRLAHLVADAQRGNAQLRALLAGREGGVQVAQRDRQRLTILFQVEVAQRNAVHRDIHGQRRQRKRLAVILGGRRVGQCRQRHAHRPRRYVAHMQPPVAQRAPIHLQMQLADVDARTAANIQVQLAHGYAAQQRTLYVQRLAVQLLRGRRQQQPRSVLRPHQPE